MVAGLGGWSLGVDFYIRDGGGWIGMDVWDGVYLASGLSFCRLPFLLQLNNDGSLRCICCSMAPYFTCAINANEDCDGGACIVRGVVHKVLG